MAKLTFTHTLYEDNMDAVIGSIYQIVKERMNPEKLEEVVDRKRPFSEVNLTCVIDTTTGEITITGVSAEGMSTGYGCR